MINVRYVTKSEYEYVMAIRQAEEAKRKEEELAKKNLKKGEKPKPPKGKEK